MEWNSYRPVSYTQNLKVIPNHYAESILLSIDSLYKDLKLLTNGRLAIGTVEGDRALFSQKNLAILGKSDSKYFIDYFISAMEYGSNEYRSPNKNIPAQSRIIIPKELTTHIPMIDLTRIVPNSQLQSYAPVTDADAYLQNFKIDFDGVSKTRLYEGFNVENVRHGLHRMFADQIKPRSLGPLQTLIVSFFSYRCNTCVLQLDDDCRCYLHSPELQALSQLCLKGKGVPFLILSADCKTIKNPDYPFISSVVPGLWYILCDLSIRTGCGAITEAFAAICTDIWVKASVKTLFGAILGKFKKMKKLVDFYLAKTDFISLEISRDNSISGAHRAGPIGTYDEAEYVKFIVSVGLDKYLPKTLYMMDNEEGRFVVGMVQYITTPSVPIKTPISLSLNVSARATMAEAPVVSTPVQYVQIRGTWVPIKYKYEDYILDGLRGILSKKLKANPPRLDRLQSDFFQAATTNSAGVDPQMLQKIREEMFELYGRSPDVIELAANAGVRLFDIWRMVTKDLASVDALNHAFEVRGVGGIRVQVGRRNRLIQMLASILMCAPFIVKTMLDLVISESGIGATGKTTNNICDMHHILYASGRDTYILFSDIKGMDTNTYRPQQAMLTEVLIEYLETQREFGFPFFLNNVNGKSQKIRVNKKTITGSNVTITHDDVSVLEYFLYLDLAVIDELRLVTDGYFMKRVTCSNITFPSGSFKTSAQHTALGVLIYTFVKELMEAKYTSIGMTISAQVLGDDQLAYCLTASRGNDMKALAMEIQELINTVLARFAYVTDSGMGFCHGEFLKQIGYHGAPSPLGSRLAQFSCETGNSFSSSCFERVKNACGVADELSARVPFPQHTVILKRYTAMVAGFISVYTPKLKESIGRKFMHHTSKAYARRTKHKAEISTSEHKYHFNFKSNDPDIIQWKNDYGDQVIIKLLRGCWYTVPNIGIPHYAMYYRVTKQITSECCWLAFPSPATLRKILEFTRKLDYDYAAEQEKQYQILKEHGFTALVATLPSVTKRCLRKHASQLTENAVVSMMLSDIRKVPVPAARGIDEKMSRWYGFTEGYSLEELMRAKLDEFVPGPVFRSAQAVVNGYLDPQLASSSHKAAYDLKINYGYSISRKLMYAYMLGSRMEDAVQKRRESTSITMASYTILHEQLKTLPQSMIDQLAYGDYTVTKGDIPRTDPCYVSTFFDTGFGSCVPRRSYQAAYIDILGLPRMEATSIDAIKESIKSLILIEGAADDVIRTLANIYRKFHKRGLEMAYDAIGLNNKQRDNIEQMFTEYGYEPFTIPFAINPRKCYYYNMTASGIKDRLFSIMPGGLSMHLQQAIYLSEIAANPDLFCHQIGIIPNVTLAVSMR